MLRLAFDENFDYRIVTGVRRRLPNVDALTVQEAGLRHADDPTLLAWAASEGRVLLTRDAETMTRYAYERVAQGLPMPGVFEVSFAVPVGLAIEEILTLVQCSTEGEWEGQVNYLPLK